MTRWGGDPVSGSPVPHRWLTTADLPLATLSKTHLGLAELPDASPRRVIVAGHTVTYDHDRRLWFCDVVIEPGPAYLPFVRMALVRFQPHSIIGTEVSRVVVVDFAQLTPDRSASMTVLSPTQVRVSLVGVGITTNAVQIEGQHRLAGGTDELLVVPAARDGGRDPRPRRTSLDRDAAHRRERATGGPARARAVREPRRPAPRPCAPRLRRGVRAPPSLSDRYRNSMYCTGTEAEPSARRNVMNDLPLATVMSQWALNRDALSARPDAPVVPHREPRPRVARTWRARTAVASGLRRAAGAIEPADCVPAG